LSAAPPRRCEIFLLREGEPVIWIPDPERATLAERVEVANLRTRKELSIDAVCVLAV